MDVMRLQGSSNKRAAGVPFSKLTKGVAFQTHITPQDRRATTSD